MGATGLSNGRLVITTFQAGTQLLCSLLKCPCASNGPLTAPNAASSVWEMCVCRLLNDKYTVDKLQDSPF